MFVEGVDSLRLWVQNPRRSTLTLLVILATSSLLAIQVSIHSVSASNCNGTSVPGLIPLNDLGNNTYQGLEGGLYPNASNSMPQSHSVAGLRLAKQIVPRDTGG